MSGVMDMAQKFGGMSINSSESTPADTGLPMGKNLHDRELNARTHYFDPYVPDQGKTFTKGAAGYENVPYYMNNYPAPPRKYVTPSATKEYMAAREAIRQNANKNGANRPDPITDQEVAYLQSMQDQAELADFDVWVNAKIDPKRPGGLPELLRLYPDFVTSRVKQAATDYEFALRKEMIDQWGVQSFDDLFFLYLCDQGKIKGPRLVRDRAQGGSGYVSGALSPFDGNMQKRMLGVKLPGTSSSYGARPQSGAERAEAGWTIPIEQTPFPFGRGLNDLAATMYPKSSTINAGAEDTISMRTDTPALYGESARAQAAAAEAARQAAAQQVAMQQG